MEPMIGAARLAQMLSRREISAVEVMEATLARVEAENGALRAIVSLRDTDVLMAEARAADADEGGALRGLPMAIKDLAQVAGMPTSMGSPVFAGQVAQASDPHVARMQAAGGIVIGKTNTPEFGLGSHTYNAVFGATQNALMPGRSAGGSSGGAAVALARGLVPVADGSDMMGSLRNPAGWNGVYGMRPSIGVVPGSLEGDLYLHPLSTNGPMGRRMDDIALLLDVMAGVDRGVPLTQVPGPDRVGRRIGWVGDWGGAWPMEDGVLDHCAAEVQRFQDTGYVVDELAPPFSAEALWQAWITLRSFAVAGKLGPVLDAYPDALKPEAIWEVERGRSVTAEQIAKASAIRSDWYRAAAGLFETFDALVMPTAACWPFPIEWDWPKDIGGVVMDTYHRWMECVIPASLIGLPCLAVPTSKPIGLQLMGRMRGDRELLAFGQAWANLRDG